MKFQDVKGKTKEKRGLWEEGKRTRWLETKELSMIEADQLDFRSLLSHDRNRHLPMVSPMANSFKRPPYMAQ